MTNESVWAGSYAPGVPLHLDYGTETLVEQFERAARKFGDRPAIDFMGQVTSYGDLARDVHRVAAALGHRPTAAERAEDEVWTPLGLKRDPEDPAVFPAKRPGYGVGVTVNLATPVGRWLVRGFVAVFIVGLPLALWLGAFAAR